MREWLQSRVTENENIYFAQQAFLEKSTQSESIIDYEEAGKRQFLWAQIVKIINRDINNLDTSFANIVKPIYEGVEQKAKTIILPEKNQENIIIEQLKRLHPKATCELYRADNSDIFDIDTVYFHCPYTTDRAQIAFILHNFLVFSEICDEIDLELEIGPSPEYMTDVQNAIVLDTRKTTIFTPEKNLFGKNFDAKVANLLNQLEEKYINLGKDLNKFDKIIREFFDPTEFTFIVNPEIRSIFIDIREPKEFNSKFHHLALLESFERFCENNNIQFYTHSEKEVSEKIQNRIDLSANPRYFKLPINPELRPIRRLMSIGSVGYKKYFGKMMTTRTKVQWRFEEFEDEIMGLTNLENGVNAAIVIYLRKNHPEHEYFLKNYNEVEINIAAQSGSDEQKNKELAVLFEMLINFCRAHNILLSFTYIH